MSSIFRTHRSFSLGKGGNDQQDVLTSQLSLGIRHQSWKHSWTCADVPRVSGEDLAEYPLEDMPASKLLEKKSTTHIRFLIT